MKTLSTNGRNTGSQWIGGGSATVCLQRMKVPTFWKEHACCREKMRVVPVLDSGVKENSFPLMLIYQDWVFQTCVSRILKFQVSDNVRSLHPFKFDLLFKTTYFYYAADHFEPAQLNLCLSSAGLVNQMCLVILITINYNQNPMPITIDYAVHQFSLDFFR